MRRPGASAVAASESQAAAATSRSRQNSGAHLLAARDIQQVLQQFLNAPRGAVNVAASRFTWAGGRSASTSISAPP